MKNISNIETANLGHVYTPSVEWSAVFFITSNELFLKRFGFYVNPCL